MAANIPAPDEEGVVTDEKLRPGEGAKGTDAPTKKRARRPWMRRAIIAATTLFVLVVIPGIAAIQPDVIGARAALKVEHETWQTSKHSDVPCQGCHAAPTPLAQVAFGGRMLVDLYASVVGSSGATSSFAVPTNESCLRCHKDLITTSPEGDLIIPHRAHTDILHVACVKCHAYLVHEKSPEGKHTPPMAICLTCHDGKQAKNSCAACHTAKATPDTHKAADWLKAHPEAAKTTDCASCHGWVKDWCADCHTRRPQSHTDDWRKKHAAVVAVEKPRNCEVCHTSSFCINCHGVVPELNYDPSVTFAQ